MDFFANQERAERQTRVMLTLFAMAVSLVILTLDGIVGLVYAAQHPHSADSIWTSLASVPPRAYWLTTLMVLGIIVVGSLRRTATLAKGGSAVAKMLDARWVESSTVDPAEQRLNHVVQEMAIAAGIAVPRVYVMDAQASINALVAGHSSKDAVVVVTQGALRHLERDELQGVIAHEFSHILNGDMRLNLRLTGVLAGIVAIGAIGDYLMHLSDIGQHAESGGRFKVYLIPLGVAAWLLGSIGLLLGTLIKAAISRQREFLADAAAVQFTRNPEGLASALARIERHGSGVVQRYGEELSHMYFSSGKTYFFATHPPIAQRMERILGARAPVIGPASVSPTTAPGPVAGARHFMRGLPPALVRNLTTTAGARATVYALAMGGPDIKKSQLALIRTREGEIMVAAVEASFDMVSPLRFSARAPLLDLLLPSLRNLSTDERKRMLALLQQLVEADAKVTVGEFILLARCRSYLKGGVPRVGAHHQTLQQVASEASQILALLQASTRQSQTEHAEFAGLSRAHGTGLCAAPSLQSIEVALAALRRLNPASKQIFVQACHKALMVDAALSSIANELLRAICGSLDVPLPPRPLEPNLLPQDWGHTQQVSPT